MDFSKAPDVPAPANPVVPRPGRRSGTRADLRSQGLPAPDFLPLPPFRRPSSAVRSRALRSRSRHDPIPVRDRSASPGKALTSQQVTAVEVPGGTAPAGELFRRIANRFFDRTI